uniref:RNA helicase n=1 Tax=Culicoides sonorensis TaxID=179676 RepID=A0A336MNR0_CULSO
MSIVGDLTRKLANAALRRSAPNFIVSAMMGQTSQNEEVEHQSDSDTDSDSETTKYWGIISKLDQYSIVIKRNDDEILKFQRNELKFEENYLPEVGDSICLNADTQLLMPDKDTKEEVMGRVTAFDGAMGLIENQHVFKKDVLKDNTSISVDDIVTCIIIGSEIEYDSKVYTSRCISVKKGSDKATAHKYKSQRKRKDKWVRKEIPECMKLVPAKLEFVFSKEGENSTKSFTIKNSGETAQNLKEIRIGKSETEDECFKISFVDKFKPCEIGNNSEYEVKILVNAKKNASFSTRVIFTFETFKMIGEIQIHIMDRDHDIQNKNKMYTKMLLEEVSKNPDVYPGEKPAKAPNFRDKRMDHHHIPNEIKNVLLKENVSHDQIHRELIEAFPELDHVLTFENYAKKFNTLLFLEETELYHQMRSYDMDKGRFQREGEYFSLEIAGLFERRPSLCIGDRLLVTLLNMPNEYPHEGWIHQTKRDKILVKFSSLLHEKYNGEEVRIMFEFSRMNFRKQHETIHRFFKEKKNHKILFPDNVVMCQPIENIILTESGDMVYEDDHENEVIEWYNKDLNLTQKKTIVNVLRGEARPLPYIIYGPPGTGKTMTLIEIINHIVNIQQNSHILVATPSNSSADLITERLIGYGEKMQNSLVRVVGQNIVERDSIPQNLRPYCATIEIAQEGTVVENPESLIPIHMLKKFGQIILAGDPKQLGPIVFNRFAQEFGFGQSYLDRLLLEKPYMPDEEGNFNEKLVSKLIDNYRSIPSILNVYNRIFYDNVLQNKITEDPNCDEMKLLHKLQRVFKEELFENYFPGKSKNCGIHFVDVDGLNEREPSSPSWYNANEVTQLLSMYAKLLKEGIQSKDIGIVSPYKLQCKKIIDGLNSKELKQEFMPKVGSVEEFQGQERKVILISTVRTCKNDISTDKKFSLGFVKEPKRMNVAISRAKSLLMIFGCHDILKLDNNWLQLIQYTKDAGTFHGSK